MSNETGLDHYATLGRTGLKVSPLALGTMTFGTEWGWGADRESTREIFDAYVEAGGNFFDSADLYTNGTAETWLGELIAARGLRDRAVIATKFGYNAEAGNPNAGGNGRKTILRAVEGSLRRLGTDFIDLYILHSWDRITPVEEVMRTLDDLVRSGKIRHAGLSNVPAWYAARAQTIAEFRGYEPIAALQLEYSLVERNIEQEFVTLGTGHGMGIMAWSPLGSGLLSGKYRPGEMGSEAAGRLAMMRDSNNPAFQKMTPRNWGILAELEAVARAIGHSMAEVAVNWVANRPGVASVIVGARRAEQIRANLEALSFEIPPVLAARLDAVSAPERPFPYSFFEAEIQGLVHGGAAVSAKRRGYFPEIEIARATR
ncbi:MAG TPA: aldo/keto reductase [Acetobacteraceae bacterium]|nr:aldo/keto reductase [Acetobacteraceae bacterium]